MSTSHNYGECGSSSHGVVLMLLDIKDEASGDVFLWGVSETGKSRLIRVDDYRAYFYIACPKWNTETDGKLGERAVDPAL